MAGRVFGEVQVSLFVAGAVFGEIWNDSRSAKCCIFQYKMLVVAMLAISPWVHESAYLLGTPSPFRVSPAWYGNYSHDYDLVPCSTGLEGVTKE